MGSAPKTVEQDISLIKALGLLNGKAGGPTGLSCFLDLPARR